MRKTQKTDYSETIKFCWSEDAIIQKFSRNNEHNLDERVRLEVEGLKLADASFKFYEIHNEQNEFVGYFGVEFKPVPFLTTFYVHPKFRTEKDAVWNFATSELGETFFSALFKINTRAISFYQKRGGLIIDEAITEDKPVVIFSFTR